MTRFGQLEPGGWPKGGVLFEHLVYERAHGCRYIGGQRRNGVANVRQGHSHRLNDGNDVALGNHVGPVR